MRDEPPQKISKLAIAAETEEDRYETSCKVKCYACNIDDIDQSTGPLSAVIDGIIKSNTYSRQEEVKAWEQEMTSCEHILTLVQEPERQIESQALGHCSMCDLQENLWLCLECGNLGCGRAQFGGSGGQSHGLAHANASNHGVAVKLGSITPDGNADVYCYRCDEERIDEDLGKHLAHWGILLAERQKTEKSLTELQIEQNLRWEFAMTTEDGRALQPLFGKGLTGLKNLGNSCYLASCLQCIFSLPQFQQRYFLPEQDPPAVQGPAQDFETQMRKLAHGLLSGRYSKPDSDVSASESSVELPYQRGLSPSMFKHLIGKGHPEFSTMRQQDAFEFLLHLFKIVTRSQHVAPLQDPTISFRFALEHRLQCLNCKRVRYSVDEQDNISVPVPVEKLPPTSQMDSAGSDVGDQYRPVTLKECLDNFTSEEIVELTCPSCGSKDGFSKRSLFKTFPEVLAVNARRFVVINWVPTKVDVPVIVDDQPFRLDDYKSNGLSEGEELLPDNGDEPERRFTANHEAMEALEQMGFSSNRCERALHATGNNDANAAMEWLFAHMDDPDIDQPLDLHDEAVPQPVDDEKVEALGQMGFAPPQARRALKETNGDLERAVDWLFNHPDEQGLDIEAATTEAQSSGTREPPGTDQLPANFSLQSIICHKGGSIHAG